MSREARLGFIRRIEALRGSRVVAYVTGDRQPFSARISEDAVRPLYEHLLGLDFAGKPRTIDLFLYSRGGDVSIPWRVVSMLRAFADEFNVLVPYKAQSAATLLSLGADSIVMGRKAELGPIDPTLVRGASDGGAIAPQEISVEDVNSFLSFVRERAQINDQVALAQMVGELVRQIGPLNLGSVNRQHSHIRLVARKLLTSRKDKMDEETIGAVIDMLTQKMYSHGHGIGRKEASDIGLPVVVPDAELEQLIWDLYLLYEAQLELGSPVDPESELEDSDEKDLGRLPVAIIESVAQTHIHCANAKLSKRRSVPSSPQINLNLNLQLPPGIDVSTLPVQSQEILHKMVEQLSQIVGQIVQQELNRQSPVTGIDIRTYGGRWELRTD